MARPRTVENGCTAGKLSRKPGFGKRPRLATGGYYQGSFSFVELAGQGDRLRGVTEEVGRVEGVAVVEAVAADVLPAVPLHQSLALDSAEEMGIAVLAGDVVDQSPAETLISLH